MSQENPEIVARAYAHFREAGSLLAEVVHPDFVWDMSKFEGWPEEQTHPVVAGAERFIGEWVDAWDDWERHLESLHEAGDKVVGILRQSACSKTSGLRAEMHFAGVHAARRTADPHGDVCRPGRGARGGRAVGVGPGSRSATGYAGPAAP